MIQDELKRCHQLVWQRRAEMEDVWPTPSVEDALRFAFCESAEAMDAHIRKTSKYARNRDKELSVRDELADCAMMLLTAMRDFDRFVPSYMSDQFEGEAERLTDICYSVADAMSSYLWGNKHIGVKYVGEPLTYIAAYPEIDLYNRIAARLDRIEKKQRGGEMRVGFIAEPLPPGSHITSTTEETSVNRE